MFQETAFLVCEYLRSQKAREVNLGHHLAAAVSFALVCMLMVFHQVPQFGASLLVRGDHGCSRAQAVWTARSPEQALCTGTAKIIRTMSDNGGSCSGTQCTFSEENYCLESLCFFKFRRAAVIFFFLLSIKVLQKQNVLKKLNYLTQNNPSYCKEF